MSTPVPSAALARPAVIQLAIPDRSALQSAYIPLFSEGGLFVSTAREFQLGMDVYLLLTLPNDPQRYPVAGKVAWINPAGISGGRSQGIGVCFPADDKSRKLKSRIEEILGAHLASDRINQTV
ncbi:MAG: hypothetical protein RLZZ555_1814 [Pseudomonadota bacterium]|jgi:type IV pilus assembly protein PilZ